MVQSIPHTLNVGMDMLLLATSESCQPCKQLKKYLKEKSIEVVTISDVNEDGTANLEFGSLAAEYMVRAVPTLIKLNEEKEELSRIVGFDVKKVNEFLGV